SLRCTIWSAPRLNVPELSMNEYMTSSPIRASASFTISVAHGDSRTFDGCLALRTASLVRAIIAADGSSSGEVNARGDDSVAGRAGVTTWIASAAVRGRLVSF